MEWLFFSRHDTRSLARGQVGNGEKTVQTSFAIANNHYHWYSSETYVGWYDDEDGPLRVVSPLYYFLYSHYYHISSMIKLASEHL